MPYAAGFFDAIVSLDAYQYFGTADLYLGYLLDFLNAGGRLGAVMPATTSRAGDGDPETSPRTGSGTRGARHARLVADALGKDTEGDGRPGRSDRGRVA
ncbi:MAG: hypothetical protein R2710_12640 [Acidimicrobiales bacterium]